MGHQEASAAAGRGALVQEIRQAMPLIHRINLTQGSNGQSPGRRASPKPRFTMNPLFREQLQHENSNRQIANTNDILVRPKSIAKLNQAPLTICQSVYEEASDQLPSTQLLSSPQPPKQLLKRTRASLPNRQHSSSLLNSSGWPFKRRPGGRSIRSSSGEHVSLLDASQPQPPSSVSDSTYGIPHASATSYKPRMFDSTIQPSK